ncbi:MAG: carboxypeptidase-like regulatory domain-containing protein [Planctomycetota bacterium]
MQKLVLGVALAVAAAAVWWLSQRDVEAPPAPPAPAAATAEPAPATTVEAPAPTRPDASATRATAAPAPRAAVTGAAAPTPPAPAEAPPGIDGRVVWADGEPAVDVVVLCGLDDASQLGLDERTTRSDDAGAFAFDDLPPGRYRVRSDRGGEVKVLLAAPGRREVSLEIPAGIAVAGRVVDDTGQPVAGAALWLSSRWTLERGARVATTDAEGTFTLRSIQTQRYLGARAAGYSPSIARYLEAREGETLSLELELTRRGASVRGTVYDAHGAPVSRALVRVGHADRAAGFVQTGSGGVARDWAPATARSDARGEFKIDGLPTGRLEVLARAPGHGAARLLVDAQPGATVPVTATLPAAASIEGIVRDAGGTPLHRAQVRSGARWDDPTRSVSTSDELGHYALGDITPGEVQVAVLQRGQVVLKTTLTVGPGQTLRWDPILSQKLGIEGRLVDASQRPLPRWMIVAMRDSEWVGTVFTGANGEFAFADLEPEAHTLRAFQQRADQAAAGERGQVAAVVRNDVMPGDNTVLLVVDDDAMPSGAVRGRVRAANGGVPTETRVMLGMVDGRGGIAVKVDAVTGEFHAEGLVPGTYRISVRSEGHPQIRVGRREVRAAEEIDLGDLQLSEGGSCSGTLRHANGSPLPDVKLELLAEDGTLTGTMRRQSDHFRSSSVARGSYRLMVSGPGLARTAVPVVIETGRDTQLEIISHQGVQVHLTARVPGTAAWVHLSLYREGESMGGSGLQAQADGTYATDLWLAPGDYRVWVGTDGSRYRGRREFTVQAGAAMRLDVPLQAVPK